MYIKTTYLKFISYQIFISCTYVNLISHTYIQYITDINKIYKDTYYIRGAFNKFPDFFVQAFKIVVDS